MRRGANNGHERIFLDRSTYVKDVASDMYKDVRYNKYKEAYKKGSCDYLSSYQLDDDGKPLYEQTKEGMYYERGYKHAYTLALKAYNEGIKYECSSDENKHIPYEYMTKEELEDIDKANLFDEEKSLYRIFFDKGRELKTKGKKTKHD